MSQGTLVFGIDSRAAKSGADQYVAAAASVKAAAVSTGDGRI